MAIARNKMDDDSLLRPCEEYLSETLPAKYAEEVRIKEVILIVLALLLLVCSIALFFKHWKKNYRDINQLPYYAYLYQKVTTQPQWVIIFSLFIVLSTSYLGPWRVRRRDAPTGYDQQLSGRGHFHAQFVQSQGREELLRSGLKDAERAEATTSSAASFAYEHRSEV